MLENKNVKLTAEEAKGVAETMSRKYASFLNDRFFEVEVRYDRQGTYVTVTLRNEKSSFHYPVEGRVADLDHQMNQRDAALFVLDYIDSYFEEFFRENGEVYLPIDWASFEWEGIPLQLKGQILNLEVEKMADQWLEAGGPGSDAIH